MLKLILLSLVLVANSAFADTSIFKCPVNARITSASADDLAKLGFSGGAAGFDNGVRTIKYDKQLEPIPEVMNHVIAHECAHHVLGHAEFTIKSYYANERLQENPADCLASKMLVRQLGYGKKEFNVIINYLKNPPRGYRIAWCAK